MEVTIPERGGGRKHHGKINVLSTLISLQRNPSSLYKTLITVVKQDYLTESVSSKLGVQVGFFPPWSHQTGSGESGTKGSDGSARPVPQCHCSGNKTP